MDLGGMVGLDGLVGSPDVGVGGGGGGCGVVGSGFPKQARAGGPEEGDWRYLKAPRSEAMLLYPAKASPSLVSHPLFTDGQQMISFSSPKQDPLVLCTEGLLPFYHPPASSLSSPPPSYVRNAGVRGPFTPSQWLELEHQALIYKYIDANVPIPPNLLIPIKKSLSSSCFPAYSTGSLRPNALGWGPFHLGFTGNADPEPGRCRRTDGKKWRCSRDAVADQKYCERHMNRGRHRSRKPVEGHSGHAPKVMPTIAPTASALAVSGSGASNNLGIAQQQMKSLQTSSTDPSLPQFTRIAMNKENVNDQLCDLRRHSVPTSLNQKPKDTLFPLPKQHNPFEESSSRVDFGLISSETLLNPPRNTYIESRSSIPSNGPSDQEHQPNPLRHFFDDWPKGRSDRQTISWPEVEEIPSSRTQLSISIPVASSDFSSSSSSPAQERATLSPLKLSRENDPIHMGLGVGGILNEGSQRQASWVPVSWEPSIGGPLGEVLNKTSNPVGDCTKTSSSSALNLMAEGWDSARRLGSSPTGVLQKTTFGSLSSSTGSSPRAETYRTCDSTSSLCDDLLGSTLANSTSVPFL